MNPFLSVRGLEKRFGAVVAYEMALQLVQQGHEIGLLAIIDQRRPGWRWFKSRNGIPVLYRMKK